LLEKSIEAKWTFINQYTKEHAVDFSKMGVFDKFLYQAKAGALFSDINPKYHQLSNMFVKEKGTELYDKAIAKLQDNTNDILRNMIHEAYMNNEFGAAYSEEFINQLLTHLFSYFDDIFTNSPRSIEKTLSNLESYVHFIKYGLKGSPMF
jgi:hypothetical protein